MSLRVTTANLVNREHRSLSIDPLVRARMKSLSTLGLEATNTILVC